MKGKIDKEGRIEIFRAGKSTRTFCPFVPDKLVLNNYAQSGHARNCGTWCVLFGEPYSTTGGTAIDLCHKALVFEEFTDERTPNSTPSMTLDKN